MGAEHVMIDLETLGIGPGHHIVSIGAVAFDTQGLDPYTFYGLVDVDHDADMFKFNLSTIAWWGDQSPEVRRALADTAIRYTYPKMLEMLSDWFKKHNAKYVWSHGLSFDVAMLNYAYSKLGMAAPWKFWDERDTRTVFDISGIAPNRASGTHHNALDDAKTQAIAVIRAMNKIGWGSMEGL